MPTDYGCHYFKPGSGAYELAGYLLGQAMINIGIFP